MHTTHENALIWIHGNKKEFIPMNFGSPISSMCVTKKYIWMTTTHIGQATLLRYSKKDGSIKWFPTSTYIYKVCSGEDCIYAAGELSVLKMNQEGEIQKSLKIPISAKPFTRIYDMHYHKGSLWVGCIHSQKVVRTDANLDTVQLLVPRKREESIHADVVILESHSPRVFYYCGDDGVSYEPRGKNARQTIINYNGFKYVRFSNKVIKVGQIVSTVIELDSGFTFVPDGNGVWIAANGISRYILHFEKGKKIYEILTREKDVDQMTLVDATESYIQLQCEGREYCFPIFREYEASSPEAIQLLMNQSNS